MTKIDGLEIVMTKHIKSAIDKELKKRFEELKPDIAKRYEELLNMRNMETDQFNDGFNDARAGKPEDEHPHYDFDTDNWRLGYAWGIFEPNKIKIAKLESQLAEWKQDAERLIQLANFKNKRAGEYFDLHEQLVKKYEVKECQE